MLFLPISLHSATYNDKVKVVCKLVIKVLNHSSSIQIQTVVWVKTSCNSSRDASPCDLSLAPAN